MESWLSICLQNKPLRTLLSPRVSAQWPSGHKHTFFLSKPQAPSLCITWVPSCWVVGQRGGMYCMWSVLVCLCLTNQPCGWFKHLPMYLQVIYWSCLVIYFCLMIESKVLQAWFNVYWRRSLTWTCRESFITSDSKLNILCNMIYSS